MANASLLRSIHQVSVLNILRRCGVSSRASLAKTLGLTRSTLTHLVNDLLRAGYVVESGKASTVTGTGRPGIGIELRPDGAYFIGADIGEGILRVLLLNLAAEVIEERTTSFAAGTVPDAVLDTLISMIQSVRATHSLEGDLLKGVGVTVPGTCVDGRIVLSPALGWRDVEVLRRLGSAVGVPVLVENAANAAALAEAYLGANEELQNLVYILLREGVGAGIVIGGEIYRGAFGAAGELGNIRLAPYGPVDTKGNIGTLEAYCSLRTLLHEFQTCGGSAASLPVLIDDLTRGRPAAMAAVGAWSEWLTQGLLAVLNVLNPQRIILGGPLTVVAAHVLDQIAARVRDEQLPGSREISILTSTLGNDIGALGGAILVYHAMFSLPELR